MKNVKFVKIEKLCITKSERMEKTYGGTIHVEFRDYKCQICGTAIRKKDGGYYVEAAHIKMKSKKGPETLDNLLILCPNHHKEFDYGDREIIKHTEKEISFKMNGNKYKINLKL